MANKKRKVFNLGPAAPLTFVPGYVSLVVAFTLSLEAWVGGLGMHNNRRDKVLPLPLPLAGVSTMELDQRVAAFYNKTFHRQNLQPSSPGNS